MPTFICKPALKCPFCASEILTVFRSKMCLSFDLVDAGERKDGASVTALLCGQNHFFFIRSCDIRIRPAVVLFEDEESA